MAMTKKEQAELAKATSYRSLRFSDYTEERDLNITDTDSPVITGFNINMSRVFTMGTIFSYRPAVYQAWSTRTHHGLGDGSKESQHRSSQGATPLYSTRKKALGALRRQLEDKFADLLMQIDMAIAEEDSRD